MTERGQTINDYLLGIILLLLSIAIVFGYFPSIFQPFEQEVSNEEEAMATNLAAEIVENSTVAETKQTANFTRLNTTIDSFVNDSERAGIPDWLRWNATVLNGTGGVVRHHGTEIQNGSAYRTDIAASTTRFIKSERNTDCQDGCELVVRVW